APRGDKLAPAVLAGEEGDRRRTQPLGAEAEAVGAPDQARREARLPGDREPEVVLLQADLRLEAAGVVVIGAEVGRGERGVGPGLCLLWRRGAEEGVDRLVGDLHRRGLAV